MSTFYGSLESERSKKPITKPGMSRLTSHTRSWDHGVRVEYTLTGKDEATCEVWLTGGSNDSQNIKLLKKFRVKNISKRKPGFAYIGGVGN